MSKWRNLLKRRLLKAKLENADWYRYKGYGKRCESIIFKHEGEPTSEELQALTNEARALLGAYKEKE